MLNKHDIQISDNSYVHAMQIIMQKLGLWEIPTTFENSLSWYQALKYVMNYIIENLIPATKLNDENVEKLFEYYKEVVDYVNNYFDDIDVKQEIENKIEQMVQSGELSTAVLDGVKITTTLCFNTVNEMLNSSNLINGGFAQTLGYYEINDGGNALYKIRALTEEDVNSPVTLITNNGLVAELIKQNIVNIRQFGAKGDNFTDDTFLIQFAINCLKEGEKLLIPEGNFLISPQNTYNIIGFGEFTPYYGLYINNKTNIEIICNGNIINKTSDRLMNCIAIQNCKNIKISGIKGYYQGEDLTNENFLQNRTLLHVNNSSNIKIDNCYAENIGGCVIFVACKHCSVKNSKGVRTDLKYISTSFFASYASTDIIIDSCVVYGSTNDGDIGLYGMNLRCTISNCRLFNTFENDENTIAFAIAQGICVDSGSSLSTIVNNYVYGYYYGIDVKTENDGVIVANNTCLKNKCGIAVRLGEGNSTTLNTIIDSNIIYPANGNGETTEFMAGTTVLGILLENTSGVQVINNLISSLYSDSETNFLGLYCKSNNHISEAYGFMTLISNNTFNFYTLLGNKSFINNGSALWIEGELDKPIQNISIIGNEFKMPDLSSVQYITTVVLKYVKKLIIRGNLFNKKLNNCTHMLLQFSSHINMSGNIIGEAQEAFTITNSSFININDNNILGGPGDCFYISESNYVNFKNNIYEAGSGSGNIIAFIKSNYCVANENMCKTSKTQIIANNNSTNIVNGTNNTIFA